MNLAFSIEKAGIERYTGYFVYGAQLIMITRINGRDYIYMISPEATPNIVMPFSYLFAQPIGRIFKVIKQQFEQNWQKLPDLFDMHWYKVNYPSMTSDFAICVCRISSIVQLPCCSHDGSEHLRHMALDEALALFADCPNAQPIYHALKDYVDGSINDRLLID